MSERAGGKRDRPALSKPPFEFDVSLLADPDRDPVNRDRAWQLVYEHFTPRLRSYFERRTATADDLDLLLAEVWRRALLKIGSLSSPQAAWSWLTTIGVNLLHDQHRDSASAARRQEHFETYLRVDPEQTMLDRMTDDPFDGIDRAEFRRRLATISDEDRELLKLFAVEELPHGEIAQRMGLPSAAASRQRLQRIRRLLRGE